MAWTKPSQGMVDLFDACLPEGPVLERRRMFGQPCAFVNGNMFAGLLQEIAFARLPPSLHAALDAEFGVRLLPEEVLEDEYRFAEVLQAAYAFTSAMPPKQKKPRKLRKT